jgi:hypothetical protein
MATPSPGIARSRSPQGMRTPPGPPPAWVRRTSRSAADPS